MTTPAVGKKPANAAPGAQVDSAKPHAANATQSAGSSDAPARADATKTIQLLFRARAADAAKALAIGDDTRAAAAGITAHAMEDAIEEAGTLVGSADWSQLEIELAQLFGAAKDIEGALAGTSLKKDGDALAASIGSFERLIPPAVAGKAHAATGPTRPLSDGDALQLAKLQLAAARKESDAVPGAAHGDPDAVAQSCRVLYAHMSQAEDTIASLPATELKRVESDISALSHSLNTVEAVLNKSNAKWHREYAQVFDSEKRLLRAAGDPRSIVRPFTGTVAPEDAAKEIRAIADGTEQAPPSGPFQDQHSAVLWILEKIREIQTRKLMAIGDFEKAIQEKVEHTEPWWQQLLELAVGAILSAASGGVATMFEKAFANAMATSSALAKSATHQATSLVTRVASGELAAAQSAKSTFDTSAKSALAAGKNAKTTTMSVTLVGQYVAANRAATMQEGDAMMKGTIQLSTPLAELSLETLNKLIEGINDAPDTAFAITQQHMLYEWENLRARAATGATQPGQEPNLNAPRQSTGETPIPGVLEIGLDVPPDFGSVQKSTFAYMVLRDGEAAAVNRLKQDATPFGSVPMNRMYQLSFDHLYSARPEVFTVSSWVGLNPPAVFVKFGVGAHGDLQLDTVDDREFRWMKLYLGLQKGGTLDELLAEAKEQVSGPKKVDWHAEQPDPKEKGTILGALQYVETFPTAAVIAALHAFMKVGDAVKTDKIEQG